MGVVDSKMAKGTELSLIHQPDHSEENTQLLLADRHGNVIQNCTPPTVNLIVLAYSFNSSCLEAGDLSSWPEHLFSGAHNFEISVYGIGRRYPDQNDTEQLRDINFLERCHELLQALNKKRVQDKHVSVPYLLVYIKRKYTKVTGWDFLD